MSGVPFPSPRGKAFVGATCGHPPFAGAPPGGGPARRAHRFCCQKRWENHQGPRFLRWLRVDFYRRRPRRLRPRTRSPWRQWAVIGWKEPGRHRRPPHWLALAVTGAPAEAQRSGFGGERRHSGGNELCRLRRSERSVTCADEAGGNARPVLASQSQPTVAMNPRLGGPGGAKPPGPSFPPFLREEMGAPAG